jgi:S-adenosyl methyltransferase
MIASPAGQMTDTDTDETPDGGGPAIASPAGIYDYWLGGTASSRADRDAAERIRRAVPEISQIAWANRGFLTRAVTWIAERGIRQFIDVGAGFPTQRATHEVAGAIAGDCRVVYTDNDPLVVARGRRTRPTPGAWWRVMPARSLPAATWRCRRRPRITRPSRRWVA